MRTAINSGKCLSTPSCHYWVHATPKNWRTLYNSSTTIFCEVPLFFSLQNWRGEKATKMKTQRSWEPSHYWGALSREQKLLPLLSRSHTDRERHRGRETRPVTERVQRERGGDIMSLCLKTEANWTVESRPHNSALLCTRSQLICFDPPSSIM